MRGGPRHVDKTEYEGREEISEMGKSGEWWEG